MPRERRTVVITSNPLNHEGGVVAFYANLLKYFPTGEYELRHLSIGSRMEHFYSPFKKLLLYPVYYAWDMLTLTWMLLIDRQVCIVQVNPSLIPVPLVRDCFVILLSKMLQRKTVVMFHGWKPETVEYMRNHRLTRWLFRQIYGRCDVAVVLANRFRSELLEFAQPRHGVHVTTTMYDPQEIGPAVDRRHQRVRFVFLGRISELKGVSEIVEASKQLCERGVDFEFVMVGHGDRAGIVETYLAQVNEYGLENHFCFTGRLTGKDKFQVLAESDVYVLPSWTEGCPTSVLEALGSGLFVISTDVGALKDIIHEGKNGRIIRLKDSDHLAEAMQWACENIREIRQRRKKIQQEAERLYEVDVVCNQFRNIYRRVLHG